MNPLGLCCLGQRAMVLPGRSTGQLQIVDLKAGTQGKMEVKIVPAHSSMLRALELSPDEQVVASASDKVGFQACFPQAPAFSCAEAAHVLTPPKGTIIRIHSTQDTTRLCELRRGIASATILSLAISPTNDRLAVTSDTCTLHIFDLPYASNTTPITHQRPNSAQQGTLRPQHSRTSSGASRGSRNSPGYSRSPTPEHNASAATNNKWGTLAKLPFAPRVFSDTYSVASCTFDPGNDAGGTLTKEAGTSIAKDPSTGAFAKDKRGRYTMDEDEDFVDILPGVPGGSPPKGVAAWIDEETLVIVNAGRDARYERFLVRADGRGGTVVGRTAWKRYLAELE